MNQHVKHLGQRSKVISFKVYYPDTQPVTQTHINRTHCSTWTTKVVCNNTMQAVVLERIIL